MKQSINLEQFKLPRWRELPEIDLYIDQVVAILTHYLKPLYQEDETIITTTMINNYTKKSVAPKPNKKRYGREHLASFMVITIMKTSFNLPEIRQAMDFQLAKMDSKAAYDYFCEMQESAFQVLISDGSIEAHCASCSKSALAVSYATISFAAKCLTNQMLNEEIKHRMKRKKDDKR